MDNQEQVNVEGDKVLPLNHQLVLSGDQSPSKSYHPAKHVGDQLQYDRHHQLRKDALDACHHRGRQLFDPIEPTVT
jgi:hypothetical protein